MDRRFAASVPPLPKPATTSCSGEDTGDGEPYAASCVIFVVREAVSEYCESGYYVGLGGRDAEWARWRDSAGWM